MVIKTMKDCDKLIWKLRQSCQKMESHEGKQVIALEILAFSKLNLGIQLDVFDV